LVSLQLLIGLIIALFFEPPGRSGAAAIGKPMGNVLIFVLLAGCLRGYWGLAAGAAVIFGGFYLKVLPIVQQDWALARADVEMESLFHDAIKNSSALGNEVKSEAFLRLSEPMDLTQLELRLAKVREFGTEVRTVKSAYLSIDSTNLTKLSEPRLSSAAAQQYIAAFHQRCDQIVLPLLDWNSKYADLLERQFGLLKREWGHWYLTEIDSQRNRITFENSNALNEWNGYLEAREQWEKEGQPLRQSLSKWSKHSD